MYELNSEAKRQGMADNILIVFVDTMSRERAHKLIPETLKYFEERQNTYEFFKMNALYTRTFENAVGFLYGLNKEELKDIERKYNESLTDPTIEVKRKEPIWDFFK